MSQSNQVKLQPGSSASTLAEHLRQLIYQVTPPVISIQLTTAAGFRPISNSQAVGYQLFPLNETLVGQLTDAAIAPLSGPSIAAQPVANLTTAPAVIPASEIHLFRGRSPVVDAETGDEVVIEAGGNSQRVYSIMQCASSVTLGGLPGATGSENLRTIFVVENGQALDPVTLPEGTYRIGVATLTQERHRGIIRFADGAMFVDPRPDMPVSTIDDEIHIQVTGLIPAGTAINISTDTGSTDRSNPTGQDFNLSDYADHAAFAADSAAQVFIGGLLALKGAIANAPNPTSETFVEWASGNSIQTNIDLWPGTFIRLIRPRAVAPIAPPLTLPPFTQAALTIPIADSSASPIIVSFALSTGGYSGPIFVELVSSAGTQFVQMPASGVPISFVDTGTGRSLRVLAPGQTASEASSNVFSVRNKITGIDGSGLTYGGSTIMDYSGGGTGINGAVIFGQNTATLLKFAVNSNVAAIDFSDGTISGYAPDSDGVGPDAGLANIKSYDELRSLDLSNNLLDAAAIAQLLSQLNEPSSLVNDLALNLGGNPGSGSVDLSNYPNLTAKSITVTGTTPPAPVAYTSVYDRTVTSGPIAPTVTYSGSTPLAARWVVYAAHNSTTIITQEPVGASGVPVSLAFSGANRKVSLEIENTAYLTDRERITGLSMGTVDTSGIGIIEVGGASLRASMVALEAFSISGFGTSFVSFDGFAPVNGYSGVRGFSATDGAITTLQNLASIALASDLELLVLRNSGLDAGDITALLTELNQPASLVTSATIDLSENPGSASINLASFPNLAAKNITVLLVPAPSEIFGFRVVDTAAGVDTPVLTFTGGGVLNATWVLESAAGTQIDSFPAALTGQFASLGGAGVPNRRLRLMAGGATPTATAIAEGQRVTGLDLAFDSTWAGTVDQLGIFASLIYEPPLLPNLESFNIQGSTAGQFIFSGSTTIAAIDISGGNISTFSGVTTTNGLLGMSGLRTLDIRENNFAANELSLLLTALVLPASLVHDLVVYLANNPGQVTISPTVQAQLDAKNISIVAGGVI